MRQSGERNACGIQEKLSLPERYSLSLEALRSKIKTTIDRVNRLLAIAFPQGKRAEVRSRLMETPRYLLTGITSGCDRIGFYDDVVVLIPKSCDR